MTKNSLNIPNSKSLMPIMAILFICTNTVLNLWIGERIETKQNLLAIMVLFIVAVNLTYRNNLIPWLKSNMLVVVYFIIRSDIKNIPTGKFVIAFGFCNALPLFSLRAKSVDIGILAGKTYIELGPHNATSVCFSGTSWQEFLAFIATLLQRIRRLKSLEQVYYIGIRLGERG